jgi:sortase A
LEIGMKKHLPTVFLILALLFGLGLLLYPTFSNYYNSIFQSRAVADYSAQVAELDGDKYDEVLKSAEEYNRALSEKGYTNFVLSDEETAEYESQLNVSDVISYIEIPSISCTLPIYHGTSEEALEAGVGHIAGSSLPVGGESTHCVLSGHRGLPEAKLFTDLDKLVEGDIFMLRTLDETLTYEVDQIRVVEPEDVSELKITDGQDYCTLVTCTPYGVNTQRLLVRGHRIENIKASNSIRVTADATQIEPVLVAPFAALPILAVMLLIVFRTSGGKAKKRRKDNA